MMKALIIEDEELAARRLSNLIIQSKFEIQIIDILDSVEMSIDWFRNNSHPELIFLDIQLADGLSFEIFDHVEVKAPILFTTAYDEYAIRAFKLNSIDYLLKPIEPEDLNSALDKFYSMQKTFSSMIYSGDTIHMLERIISSKTGSYKNRFIVKIGEHIYPVDTSSILSFSSIEGITYLYTEEKKYPVDFPLDRIESMVDPQLFFRVNRNYIVHIKSIKEMIRYSSNRVKLILMFMKDHEIVVSRDRMNEFRKWVDN